jgi:uncharacterized membrane protein
MKKLYVFAAIGVLATALTYCSSAKKAAKATTTTTTAAKASYATTVAPVVMSACSPCHIAGKGNKKPFDNYANVKSDIDEIIKRIELNPGDKGFMPFRRATKLSADTIAMFKKFKEDGLLEN